MTKHRKHEPPGTLKKRVVVSAVSVPLMMGFGTAVAWADENDGGTDQGATDKTTTGQSTENTTDTTNQVTDSKPDTPANTPGNTPAPEPSEPPASETSVVEPDAVADLKPHVSDPGTPVAKPGVVSATEIEVRAKSTQSAKPSHPTKPTQSAKPAIPATPAEPAQPATPAEPPAVANVVVAQPMVTAEPPAPVVVMSAPEAQVEVPDTATKVVTNALGAVGLNPFASSNPLAPADSPAMWAMLAMARKREDVEEPSSFGRMFPDLEPLNQQTTEELKEIAQGDGQGDTGMLEPATINNPKGTTGGITFFGQFIDHDLTLDTLPQPDSSVDPTTLVNSRTFAFDLDSVYGGGPSKNPELYDGDKFKIGVATDGVTPDLPRNPDGSAILVEHRNDENLIIAQIHLSFLRLHNKLIDEGMSYDEAHDTVVEAYRYVVLHDYLPQIVGQDTVDAALKQPVKKGFYQPGKGAPMTPVEFSVAAFRFGHSQIRNAYNINDTSNGVPVFSLNGALDLSGGRQLPAIEDPANGLKSLVIDFDNFFSELPQDGGPLLIGRAIDTKISNSLFQLPIPGAEGGGSNVLAFRNLLRAKFYDMPSFESVAKAMGVPPLVDPATGLKVDPLFPDGTPLWFGILREAELTSGGAELGPVGGGIVAEVFVDVLRQDNNKSINQKKVNLPDVSGGDFRIGDLLVAADQPQGEEPRPPAEQPCRGGGVRPILDPAHEGLRRHRLHQQLHWADDSARERSGRHRLHQQLHEADDPAPGRHRLFEQLHGADD